MSQDTERLEQRIKQRLAGRQSAHDCWSLVEPGLDDPDFCFREAFVEHLQSLTGLLARERELYPPREARPPIARLGATVMPFGTHKGKCLDDVPLQYLDWLCRSQEEFCRDLRAYFKHPQLEARRSGEIGEPI